MTTCQLLVAAVLTLLSAEISFAGGDVPLPRANPAALTDVADGSNWASYGRTFDENHYSPLAQISETNIRHLGLSWWLDLPPGTTVGAPLEIDGVIYLTSGLSVLRAVNVRSGRLLWVYDPEVAKVAGAELRGAWGARGIAWWNGKIYVGTMDGRLIAVDAKSGKLVWSSQTTQHGDGLYISGPPRVFNGKVIIGNGGADWGGVRGYVTTYDAETGRQLWRFYTVPGDPAKGFENDAMAMAAKTWGGEWWKQGGGGTVWNSITYDPQYNRIYLGVGNGAPWNANLRSPGNGDNLFLCSIVALDADTGRYVWHYQVNPREQWDYTASMDIELATLLIDGRRRDVILHAPKNGFFYVIDRETGKVISAEPFTKVTWAKAIDLASGRPIENPGARPNNSVVEVWPSGAGGHNWEPMSFSPLTGLVYIPTIELPGTYDDRGVTAETWRRKPGVVLDTGYNVPDFSIPVPPADAHFGALQAWDPVKQVRVWSVPLRAAHSGGVLSTAGNLVFQGQMDGQFVARDSRTGNQLWSFTAADGIIGQPITYSVGGQQYVTVITGLSSSPSLLGGIASQFGWTYRGQQRRVLTFVIDGTATLPASMSLGPEKVLKIPTFKVDPTLAVAGAVEFNTHCFTCHGAGAVAGGGAPDLRASPIPASSEAFYKIVHDGLLLPKGMPKFDDLDAQQILSIQHYIRSRAEVAATADSQ